MKSVVPQGSTIPASTNFITNFTRLLKVTDSLEGNEFSTPNPDTPGINTVLSGGVLSNLNDPVLDSQGATYAYTLAHGGTSNPGGPLKSVQYNNSGAFGGNSSLSFDKNTNTLTTNKISNGTINIGLNTISGLSDPTLGQQAATKNYVDNYTSLTITTNNTVGATTYSAASVVNGLIYRNTQTSGPITDTLPTAAQIIAESGASVGAALNFSIKNTSADLTSVFNFNTGTGITTGFQINVYPGYQYNAVMLVTDIGIGTEAIQLHFLNNARTNTDKWGIEIGGFASTVGVFNVTDYLFVFNDISNINSSLRIRTADVSNKIITLNNATPVNAVMDKPDSFMGILAGSDFITSPFIWTTGGMDFYVMNLSTTPGADVTITGLSGVIPWSMDPNSNMTIPIGYTGWFMVVLEVTDYPSAASLNSATVYTLGIFPSA